MNRKLLILLLLIGFVVLAFWSPWLYLKLDFAQLFGVSGPESISGLQVHSLAGELEVYLDGELKGTSSADKEPLILDRVVPGDYLLTLKRKSDARSAYWDFNKLITFVPGMSVIVSYNLGPEEIFSEGHIIYTSKKESISEKSKLHIEMSVDDPEISIEDLSVQRINSREYLSELTFDKTHKITIKKSGYEGLEFVILPDNQDERNAVSQFNLNIDIQLMLQPVKVE